MLAGVFSALAPISSDLYLPSLPSIAHYFHASINLTQFSMTTYMLGFAMARLVMATLSDFVGRRQPLLISLVICFMGALLCWQAPSIAVLLLARFVQGFGGGGANALARVILRDTAPLKELPKYSSYNSMVAITLMAAAPLLGGYLQQYANWHVVFFILFVYSCLAFVIAWIMIPETNVHYQQIQFSVRTIFLSLKTLLGSFAYIKYALTAFLAFGVMVAWLTAGAVVLQKVLLLTAVQYGWCAALVAVGYFMGSYINSRLVGALGVRCMMWIGALSVVCAGMLMITAFFLLRSVSLLWILVLCFIAYFGASCLFANSYASALMPYPKIAGIATAIFGFIQLLGASLTSAFISWAPDVNQLPLSLVIVTFGILLVVLQLELKK